MIKIQITEKAINRSFAFIMSVLVILFLFEGCGRKAPPRLPGKNNDKAVMEQVEFQVCPV